MVNVLVGILGVSRFSQDHVPLISTPICGWLSRNGRGRKWTSNALNYSVFWILADVSGHSWVMVRKEDSNRLPNTLILRGPFVRTVVMYPQLYPHR